MNIVDRRPNPKGKSLSNRQRFIARARAELKGAVQDALRKRKVAEVGSGEKVSIPTKGIGEPSFRHSRRTGHSDYVVPGNKEYVVGDEIPRPSGGGGGSGGSDGAPDGEGEDSFEFTLSKEEFLDMFFEDLELPDLVKKTLKESTATDMSRAGYTISGAPANLSVTRTMRNSMARRISMRRPKPIEVELLEAELAQAESAGAADEVARLTLEIETLLRRTKLIPFIDPVDVRYKRFEHIPRPNTQAVMFCLMDVSGSMTEGMKDLAKRFFMLLHVFLERRYKTVDVVFIRHTSTAEEVDEETFFYSRETGGTVVSSALEKMLEIARARYPLDTWNIYAAQASDGDNYGSDSGRCVEMLNGKVLPLCQYFAYIEVGDAGDGPMMRDTDLWHSYSQVAPGHSHFAMKRVSDPTQIFSVFHELFSKERARG
ncbi:MAG: hypothetical protein JWL84_908 [Rhodospirillales bacterium]|nr:hypothetical protein [Rhodospirillales bacterium]